MWEPAVSGMEKAHNCADLSYRRIRRYSVWRLKRLEARDFSHVRFTDFDNVISIYIEAPRKNCVESIMKKLQVSEPEAHELISKTAKQINTEQIIMSIIQEAATGQTWWITTLH